jgi:mono/diheme cytochrome c family protein/thiol-disulfide isomerase/thioredoxin
MSRSPALAMLAALVMQAREARDLVVPGARATVLVLVSPTCPISNSYAPALERLSTAHGSDVAVRLVYSEPDLEAQAVEEHRASFGLSMPFLLDPRGAIATELGARVVPEAFVLDAEGRVVYRGRIDDAWTDLGQRRGATRFELRAALEAQLAGRAIETPETEGIGCLLPWSKEKASADAPTWSGAIGPLVARHCTGCHRADGPAPFALDSATEAAKRARTIALATRRRLMPPWKPAPGPPVFADARRLTAEEIELIGRWAEAGAPMGEGNESDGSRAAPASAEPWVLGEPDLVLEIDEPFDVPAKDATPGRRSSSRSATRSRCSWRRSSSGPTTRRGSTTSSRTRTRTPPCARRCRIRRSRPRTSRARASATSARSRPGYRASRPGACPTVRPGPFRRTATWCSTRTSGRAAACGRRR